MNEIHFMLNKKLLLISYIKSIIYLPVFEPIAEMCVKSSDKI